MDIILTGIARSGTTLTCFLLNKLPQTVALHEPMDPSQLVGLAQPDEYLARIAEFFATQRATLLAAGTAVTKACGGRVPENPFAPVAGDRGLRASLVANQEVQFDKPLLPGFRLAVKHPNLFTATLATLQPRYACYAVIRNPLAVLLSWQTIQAPVRDGHLPFGEAFDPELKSALAEEPDRTKRQLMLLRWYFSRYRRLLPAEHVIRYEELIASGGRVLAVIDPDAAALAEPLESRNRSALYDAALVTELSELLLADADISAGFYSAEAIAALRDEWLA